MTLPLGGTYCTQLEQLEWNGQTIRPGDVIRHRTQVDDFKTRVGMRWEERTSTVLELYVENHPNVGEPRHFAETDHKRVWFSRDRVELYELGQLELTAPATGMMF